MQLYSIATMLHCITGHGVRARTSHGSLGVTAQHAGGHAWVKRSAGDLYSRSGSCIIACDGVRRTANGESPDCAIHLQASNQRTGMNEHIPITLHSTQFLHITRSEVLQLSSCYSRLQDLQGQGWGSVKNPLAGAVVAWRKTGHLRLAVVTDQGCLTGITAGASLSVYSTTPEVAISDLLDEPWDKLCPKELAAAALDLATFWPTCLGSSEQVLQTALRLKHLQQAVTALAALSSIPPPINTCLEQQLQAAPRDGAANPAAAMEALKAAAAAAGATADSMARAWTQLQPLLLGPPRYGLPEPALLALEKRLCQQLQQAAPQTTPRPEAAGEGLAMAARRVTDTAAPQQPPPGATGHPRDPRAAPVMKKQASTGATADAVMHSRQEQKQEQQQQKEEQQQEQQQQQQQQTQQRMRPQLHVITEDMQEDMQEEGQAQPEHQLHQRQPGCEPDHFNAGGQQLVSPGAETTPKEVQTVLPGAKPAFYREDTPQETPAAGPAAAGPAAAMRRNHSRGTEEDLELLVGLCDDDSNSSQQQQEQQQATTTPCRLPRQQQEQGRQPQQGLMNSPVAGTPGQGPPSNLQWWERHAISRCFGTPPKPSVRLGKLQLDPGLPVMVMNEVQEVSLVVLFRRTVGAETWDLQKPVEKQEQLLAYAVHGRCLALPPTLTGGVFGAVSSPVEADQTLVLLDRICLNTLCVCDAEGQLIRLERRGRAANPHRRRFQYARLHPDYLQRILRHDTPTRSRTAWQQQLEAAGLAGLSIPQLQPMGPCLVVYDMLYGSVARLAADLLHPEYVVWQPPGAANHDMDVILPAGLQPQGHGSHGSPLAAAYSGSAGKWKQLEPTVAGKLMAEKRAAEAGSSDRRGGPAGNDHGCHTPSSSRLAPGRPQAAAEAVVVRSTWAQRMKRAAEDAAESSDSGAEGGRRRARFGSGMCRKSLGGETAAAAAYPPPPPTPPVAELSPPEDAVAAGEERGAAQQVPVHLPSQQAMAPSNAGRMDVDPASPLEPLAAVAADVGAVLAAIPALADLVASNSDEDQARH